MRQQYCVIEGRGFVTVLITTNSPKELDGKILRNGQTIVYNDFPVKKIKASYKLSCANMINYKIINVHDFSDYGLRKININIFTRVKKDQKFTFIKMGIPNN